MKSLSQMFDSAVNKIKGVTDASFNKISEATDSSFNKIREACGLETKDTDTISNSVSEASVWQPMIYKEPKDYWNGSMNFDLFRYLNGCGCKSVFPLNLQFKKVEGDEDIMAYSFCSSNYEWKFIFNTGLITALFIDGDAEAINPKLTYTAQMNLALDYRTVIITDKGNSIGQLTLESIYTIIKNLAENPSTKEPLQNLDKFTITKKEF